MQGFLAPLVCMQGLLALLVCMQGLLARDAGGHKQEPTLPPSTQASGTSLGHGAAGSQSSKCNKDARFSVELADLGRGFPV